MFKLYRVTGNSLYPTLKDRELLFCKKVNPSTILHLSDIIVFSKEPHGRMIKQITKIENNKYYVEGTVPASIDSRVFGYLDKSDITYRVLFRFWSLFK